MHVLALFLAAGQRIELRVPFACVQCLVFFRLYIMLLRHIWIDCNIIFQLMGPLMNDEAQTNHVASCSASVVVFDFGMCVCAWQKNLYTEMLQP